MKRARGGGTVQEGGGKGKCASLLMLTEEEEEEEEEGEGEELDWVPLEEGSGSKKRVARSGSTKTPRGKQQASTRRDGGGGGPSVSQGGARGGGALDGLVICCSGTLSKIRSAFQAILHLSILSIRQHTSAYVSIRQHTPEDSVRVPGNDQRARRRRCKQL